MRAARVALFGIALGLFASCSGGDPPTGGGQTIVITVTPKAPVIEVGQTVQLHATVGGPVGTPQAVSWTSRDPEIVQVSNTGLVRGLAQGAGIIRVSWLADTQEFTDVTVAVDDRPIGEDRASGPDIFFSSSRLLVFPSSR